MEPLLRVNGTEQPLPNSPLKECTLNHLSLLNKPIPYTLWEVGNTLKLEQAINLIGNRQLLNSLTSMLKDQNVSKESNTSLQNKANKIRKKDQKDDMLSLPLVHQNRMKMI